MKQFQEQFEAALSALERDARASSIFVYTELTLHHFFGGDFDVLDRVNRMRDFGTAFWHPIRRLVS